MMDLMAFNPMISMPYLMGFFPLLSNMDIPIESDLPNRISDQCHMAKKPFQWVDARFLLDIEEFPRGF